ncbi:hypothetical protein NIE88_09550 [Sporolactobacillus shoreicorticis]|uniref:Uncharacterized protein n=1 Tax=Sporolactobacillus shoreicorticis TaxID=1923877 RepID=A0ABW5S7V5_9BACL|nr:hypothetical protein [Sporolactobacillus shoreicorticis]MCO7126019.1 hypothetical protein [Sporolactobacillus shoreicorticis]
MAQKTWAYIKINNEWKHITIYEALHRRKETRSKIFDRFFETKHEKEYLELTPVRTSSDGKVDHFRYKNKEHPKIDQNRNNMTYTHAAYEMALVSGKCRKLLLFEKFPNMPTKKVTVYVQSAEPEVYYVAPTSGESYRIDVLLNLDHTFPYSYFYKWNGKLAIEIWVNHKITDDKRNNFNDSNLPIFQARIKENMMLNENKIATAFQTSEIYGIQLFTQEIENLVHRINKENGFILGAFFDQEVRPNFENEGRYNIMSDYENELFNYKKRLQKQREQIDSINQVIQKRINGYNNQTNKLHEVTNEIANNQNQLQNIKAEINHKLAVLNSQQLNPDDYTKLQLEINKKNKELLNLNHKMEKMKNRNLLERILNKDL